MDGTAATPMPAPQDDARAEASAPPTLETLSARLDRLADLMERRLTKLEAGAASLERLEAVERLVLGANAPKREG